MAQWALAPGLAATAPEPTRIPPRTWTRTHTRTSALTRTRNPNPLLLLSA